MTDVTTGLNGALAALAALWHRKQTGKGQFVEVPLYDTGAFNTTPLAVQYMAGGAVPVKLGNADHWAAPANRYVAACGQPIMVVADCDRSFLALMGAIDQPALGQDPRYRTAEGRIADRATLDAAVAAAISARPADYWISTLRGLGVPAAPIREIPEALASVETMRRGLAGTAPHPVHGTAPELAPPYRLKRRGLKPAQAAPMLGQDTAAVLQRWLGYDSSQLKAVGAEEIAS
mgnify:FL=1